MPKELWEGDASTDHLWEYLHLLPSHDEVGVPEYHESLSRDLGDLENPNVIYPVKNGAFVHIYPDPKDARDYYIPIEPGMTEDLSAVMQEVDVALADHVNELTDPDEEDDAKKQAKLRELLERVTTVKKNNGKGRNKKGKIELNPSQFRAVCYLADRDKYGLGLLAARPRII